MTHSRSIGQWLTWLIWGLILFNVVLVFAVPVDAFTTLAQGLAYFSWLTLTSLLAVSWFAFAYRSYFQSWPGWVLSLVLVVLSLFFTIGTTLHLPAQLDFFFAILVLPTLWLLFLSTIVLSWRRDVGLLFLGWVPVIFIWAAFLSWRYQGNIIEMWLNDLNQPDAPSSLWWLNTLFCLSFCILPIAAFSFLGHTIRLLAREFRQV